ncbi:putative peptidase [Thioalkalivibrio nitratireducens DSM 14787]|uniref:Peptidase n=1 Tax=Thioalkalivibrio nitratireducens (strain DSM 14787 / UNIQEM 213 / ALEN2) TaxID=1255043 RepID=L0E0D3_THIND|nr:putative peptidase [Thioalkalivibrio nitratireducens DSM 14787]
MYQLALTLPLLMLAAVALPAAAENSERDTQPLLDIELFFKDPQYSAARISPDGETVAFRSHHAGAMNLWVKAVDAPFDQARPVTAHARSVGRHFWSRDGRFLLYAQDRDGDENFEIRAVDPLAEPSADAEVPPSRGLAGAEGARAIVYHLPRDEPDVMYVGLNDRDPSLHDVHRVHIAAAERELMVRNDAGIQRWHFDQGRLRKASRTTADGSTEILRVSGEGELGEVVYQCSFQESCSLTRFHPDGQRIYLRTNAGQRDLVVLVLFDPDSREEQQVHQDPEQEVDLGRAIFSQQDDRLLATVYAGDRQRIYAHDEDFATHLDRLQELLPEGNLDITSTNRDETRWTVALTRDTDPGTVYLYDTADMALSEIYRVRPDLPSEHLAQMEPIRYTARDGTEIPAYLTLPPGQKPRNLPVVVHPHGGPWLRDTWGYRGTVQFLANRGYAVLQPNFRGSSGYGKEFLNAGNRGWGTGVMQHDITDGVKHLIDEGIADPDRIAIYGASYGGFATLAGLAFTPDLYAAGVSVVGPSNIITLVESFPAYWRPGIARWQRRVGDPEDPEDRERLKAQSPLFSAQHIRAPLMVVHGANDPRVVQAESDQIVRVLRDAGHDVAYYLAPDEGHGLVDETNRLAVMAALEDFLAEHLGGRLQDAHPQRVEERREALRVDRSTLD